MKHIQKIIALFSILGLIHISYAGSLWVDEIKVIDSNTISVMLSENPNLNVWEIDAEVTLLNDVSTRGAVLSDISDNQVELMLEDAILPNTSYSLLTISWEDGSIDFTTTDSVEWFSAINNSLGESQDIDKIEMIDDRTMIISYTNDLLSDSYEFKLLAESRVVTIEKPDYYTPELIITLDPPLIWNQDYILMFIDLEDIDGNYIEFDTGIYDFTTEDIEEAIQEEALTQSGSITEETTEESDSEMVDEELKISESEDELLEEENNVQDEELIELEAAPEVSLEKTTQDDITTVASTVTSTPDTGAETWIIIFATLFINTLYYWARRKKAITA